MVLLLISVSLIVCADNREAAKSAWVPLCHICDHGKEKRCSNTKNKRRGKKEWVKGKEEPKNFLSVIMVKFADQT